MNPKLSDLRKAAPDMYEALTLTGNFLKGFKREFPHLFKKSDSEWVRFNAIIEQALTKAEGK